MISDVFHQVQVGIPNIFKSSDTADFGTPSGTYCVRACHWSNTREVLSSILVQNTEVEIPFTILRY